MTNWRSASLMSDVSGMLGLAKRSGSMLLGDGVIKSIQSRKARLVILTLECGANTKKKLIDKCTFYAIPYVFIAEDAFNQAIGTHNRKAAAIVNEGFAQKLYTCLKG